MLIKVKNPELYRLLIERYTKLYPDMPAYTIRTKAYFDSRG
jgi:hypothetical protein